MFKRFSFFLLLLISNILYSQKPLDFNDANSILKVNKNAFYLEDKNSSYSIQDAIKATFSPLQYEVANFSISPSAFWIKFNLKNNTNDSNLIINIEHATLDSVTLFAIDEKTNNIDSFLLTENVAFEKRFYNYQTYMFNVCIPQNGQKMFYVRVKASEQILVPISIGTEKKMLESLSGRDLIFGLYIGIILVMILYNLFLSFSITDAGYVYYVLYILFVGLSQAVLQGYSFRFLWPQHAEFNAYAGVIIPFLNGIAALEYVRHFLNLKQVSRKMSIGISALNILYLIALGFCFWGDFHLSQVALQISAFLGAFYILVICIILTRKNYRHAQILLIAWLIFIFSIIIFVLRNFGILPYNLFTFYALQIGSAIEAILLSIALADKINVYRKEQAVAKGQALIAVKENERLVREQNAMLEKEVKHRTADLEQTNSELTNTLDKLRAAQTQLVESEKMASLGQLTAGVAHEINNPINFVASNVKPLQLDINDMWELIKKYDNIDVNKNIAEQFKEIENFKKEIDINYINNEINDLLSGIKEGAERTAEIVKNLKDFSRVDQSNVKKVDLKDGITSTLVLLRNSFPKNLVVSTATDGLPQVECIPGKINQIFMNIISNSIHAVKEKQFAEGEQGKIDIKAWADADGQQVHVSIKDNGTGIPESARSKIFEPFFTTKDVGHGTGLGMSIVRGIVDKHNGKIDFTTEIGIGTEFILTLPVDFDN